MKIWMRLGVSFHVPDDIGTKILAGDTTTLLNTLYSPGQDTGRWCVDGDSYIPQEVMENLGFNDEVNFDITPNIK